MRIGRISVDEVDHFLQSIMAVSTLSATIPYQAECVLAFRSQSLQCGRPEPAMKVRKFSVSKLDDASYLTPRVHLPSLAHSSPRGVSLGA